MHGNHERHRIREDDRAECDRHGCDGPAAQSHPGAGSAQQSHDDADEHDLWRGNGGSPDRMCTGKRCHEDQERRAQTRTPKRKERATGKKYGKEHQPEWVERRHDRKALDDRVVRHAALFAAAAKSHCNGRTLDAAGH